MWSEDTSLPCLQIYEMDRKSTAVKHGLEAPFCWCRLHICTDDIARGNAHVVFQLQSVGQAVFTVGLFWN